MLFFSNVVQFNENAWMDKQVSINHVLLGNNSKSARILALASIFKSPDATQVEDGKILKGSATTQRYPNAQRSQSEKPDEFPKDTISGVIGRFQIGRVNNSAFVPSNNSRNNTVVDSSTTCSKDGFSGIRKYLTREKNNSTIKNPTCNGNDSLEQESFQSNPLKKSLSSTTTPSCGSVSSYWSKIASNQPSFLRKFFEKVGHNTLSQEKNRQSEPRDTKIIGSISNSKDHLPKESILTSKSKNLETPYDLENKLKTRKWDKIEMNGHCKAPKDFKDCRNIPQLKNELKSSHNTPKFANNPEKLSYPKNDDDEGCIPPVIKGNEPSLMSLKDRVNMFNSLCTTPGVGALVNPGAASILVSQKSPLTAPKNLATSISAISLHSRFPNTEIDSSYDNLTSYPLFRNHSTNNFSVLCKKLNSPVKNPSTPISIKNRKKLSPKRLSRSIEIDYQSEDGEISSGGMEVAEIISRSFENSPL